jgi:hypothetical protein
MKTSQRLTFALLAIGGALSSAQAQTQPPQTAATKSQSAKSSAATGPACAQVLQLSSTEWIAQYTKDHSTSADDTIAAINTYAKCYDARSSHLAASLGKAGKGPLMGASGNFRDFQAALKDFSAKALADTIPPADPVKTAYASLYALQFRYEFLQGYATKKDAQSGTLTPDQDDEMAKAKNRFGELLGLLKMAQFHEVHLAFSKVLDSQINDVTKLEVYRYGIFLLARPGEKPFSPPPF